MKIVTIEELKKMPNGTVFCEMDKWCNFQNDFRIITGKHNDRDGFNGELGLYPFIYGENRFELFERKENETWMPADKNHVVKGKEFDICAWETVDTADYDYEKDQIFAVFNEKEVREMIKCLQWALSGCAGVEPCEQREVDIECEDCKYRLSGECKGVREMWNIKPLSDYDECPCLHDYDNEGESNNNADT